MADKKRNSFLEIFRFAFSFFILFYHGYFVVDTSVFCNSNYFVDFFFILSGVYFLTTISRFEQYSVIGGSLRLLLDRMKKLGIPLLISYLCVLATWFIPDSRSFALRYLWFVHILLLMYLAVYFLKRFIKTKKVFFSILIVAAVICFVARFISLINFGNQDFNDLINEVYEMDEFRGVFCIILGIFISKIPTINFKSKIRENVTKYILLTLCLIVIALSIYFSSNNLVAKKAFEICLDLVVFPLLIYLSRYIVFSCKFIDVLGRSSTSIYLYQCIALLLRAINVENRLIHFSVIILAVLLTLLFDYRKNITKIFIRKERAS